MQWIYLLARSENWNNVRATDIGQSMPIWTNILRIWLGADFSISFTHLRQFQRTNACTCRKSNWIPCNEKLRDMFVFQRVNETLFLSVWIDSHVHTCCQLLAVHWRFVFEHSQQIIGNRRQTKNDWRKWNVWLWSRSKRRILFQWKCVSTNWACLRISGHCLVHYIHQIHSN